MTIATKNKLSLVKQVVADLFRHEAFREYAYPDPLSDLHKKYPRQKWGFRPAREILSEIGVSYEDAVRRGAPWTYGVGFTHGVTPDHKIDLLRATRLLEDKILEMDCALSQVLSWYNEASFVSKTILINMGFNMGLKGLLGFRNTLNYVKNKQYKQAAANMKKSLWATQVPRRANELARRMDTQEIPEQYLAK